MAKETERKFLVNISKLPELKNGLNRDQGYLSVDPCVRIIITNPTDETLRRSLIAVKGDGTIERDEFEYLVPNKDGRSIFKLSKYVINKTRYLIRDEEQGLTWELDEFHGNLSGLWLVEVELESKDIKPKLPEWVGKEVTEDIRYYSMYLAMNGKWWT